MPEPRSPQSASVQASLEARAADFKEKSENDFGTSPVSLSCPGFLAKASFTYSVAVFALELKGL